MGLHVDTGQSTRTPVGHETRRPSRRRRSFSSWLDMKAAPYLLITPYYLLFLLFGLFPLGFTLWYSLYDYDLAGTVEWAGLGNYTDRKSTRLNSSHVKSSYAVFCLKKTSRPSPPCYAECLSPG